MLVYSVKLAVFLESDALAAAPVVLYRLTSDLPLSTVS